MKPLDLIGNKYGILTVISENGSNGKSRLFLCICDCGTQKTIIGSELKKGNHKSCGCKMGKPKTTFEYRNHPLYDIWKGMKSRCRDKNHGSYNIYGGNGVKVCKLWENDFFSFYNWSIKNGYKNGLQLDKDKKAKEKGVSAIEYSPEMCTWLTRTENIRLRSGIKLSEEIVNDIRQSTERRIDICRKYKINPSTFYKVKKNKIWKI